MFTHLHGHSHYSLLEGLGEPSKIIAKAKELGMDSIAITDYNGMYGAVEFYELAKKAGIKAIIGVELSFVNDISKKEINEKECKIVLLAKNEQGYQNLLKIVSIANLDGFHNSARIDKPTLSKYKEGIIGYMGGERSLLGHMINSNETDERLIDTINEFKNILGQDGFYLELIAQDYKKIRDLAKINEKIIQISKQTNTTLIINNNYHYRSQNEKESYEVLLCIKEGKYVNSPDRKSLDGDFHIFTEQEIKDTMIRNGYDEQFILEIIENNNKISSIIDTKISLGRMLFPKYESPDEIKELYQVHSGNLEIIN